MQDRGRDGQLIDLGNEESAALEPKERSSFEISTADTHKPPDRSEPLQRGIRSVQRESKPSSHQAKGANAHKLSCRREFTDSLNLQKQRKCKMQRWQGRKIASQHSLLHLSELEGIKAKATLQVESSKTHNPNVRSQRSQTVIPAVQSSAMQRSSSEWIGNGRSGNASQKDRDPQAHKVISEESNLRREQTNAVEWPAAISGLPVHTTTKLKWRMRKVEEGSTAPELKAGTKQQNREIKPRKPNPMH